MRTYKVKALSVGARGKRIFHSGDTVTEGNFIAGRADELVKQGFLEVLTDDGEPVKGNEDKDLGPEITPHKKENINDPGPTETKEKKDEERHDTDEYRGITRNELMGKLDEAEVDYSGNASKAELFDLWKSLKTE